MTFWLVFQLFDQHSYQTKKYPNKGRDLSHAQCPTFVQNNRHVNYHQKGQQDWMDQTNLHGLSSKLLLASLLSLVIHHDFVASKSEADLHEKDESMRNEQKLEVLGEEILSFLLSQVMNHPLKHNQALLMLQKCQLLYMLLYVLIDVKDLQPISLWLESLLVHQDIHDKEWCCLDQDDWVGHKKKQSWALASLCFLKNHELLANHNQSYVLVLILI
mmetsp:Transcript_9180/g.13883  ORF Transcript_9180/g.13883 Transcript_9180/m.13883 type:complete len:216 (+) Transcript_9180:1035-1682(+)